MLVGIVEVNDRRYCCGVWPDVKAFREEVNKYARNISRADMAFAEGKWASAMFEGAVAAYDVELRLGEEDGMGRDDAPLWCTEADGFVAYEYDGAAPGFMGCDED